MVKEESLPKEAWDMTPVKSFLAGKFCNVNFYGTSTSKYLKCSQSAHYCPYSPNFIEEFEVNKAVIVVNLNVSRKVFATSR